MPQRGEAPTQGTGIGVVPRGAKLLLFLDKDLWVGKNVSHFYRHSSYLFGCPGVPASTIYQSVVLKLFALHS